MCNYIQKFLLFVMIVLMKNTLHKDLQNNLIYFLYELSQIFLPQIKYYHGFTKLLSGIMGILVENFKWKNSKVKTSNPHQNKTLSPS